jgi:hypothetical protein
MSDPDFCKTPLEEVTPPSGVRSSSLVNSVRSARLAVSSSILCVTNSVTSSLPGDVVWSTIGCRPSVT